jgi:hypothetical protein
MTKSQLTCLIPHVEAHWKRGGRGVRLSERQEEEEATRRVRRGREKEHIVIKNCCEAEGKGG